MRKKILIGALAVLALVPVLLLPVSAADLLIDIVPEDINVTDTEYVDVHESRFKLLAVFVQITVFFYEIFHFKRCSSIFIRKVFHFVLK